MSKGALLVGLALLLAGCAQPQPAAKVALLAPQGPAPMVTHVLTGSAEPAELVAPTFKLIGAIAHGLLIVGGGEPSIASALDGTLYISFPGCDTAPYASVAGPSPCPHGPVYKSSDRGATWKKLNRPDGRLTAEGPNANGDADVAVDVSGTVYASDLGGPGIQAFRSTDKGATWKWLGNVVEPRAGSNPPTYGSDRNWMAAAGPGHMILAWMDTGHNRSVAANTTFDGGETWTGAKYISKQIGWLGTVQFHPNGEWAYIPFTSPSGTAAPNAGRTFEFRVARTFDGGRTWDEVGSGVKIRASGQGAHFSGVMMAPALDVTGDGHLVYAWSEEIVDPLGVNAIGSRVRVITSANDGATWSAPLTVSTTRQAIMPWVTAGAGDRYSVAYFASESPGDSDYVPGIWSLNVVVADGAASSAPKLVRTLVDPQVHVGTICMRGTGCSPPVVSDRELLDFFETDLLPDGSLAITYPSADPRDGRNVEIKVAIQNGGTPLLVPRS